MTGAGIAAMRRLPDERAETWSVTNFRGSRVNLLAGPVTAAGAALGAPTAATVIAASGAVAAGRYDDVVGARPEQRRDKGFRGHLAALESGRLSAGGVKVVGIGATALIASLLRGRGPAAERLLDAVLLAGTANLVNLLDLRPGRAAKVVLLTSLVGLAIARDREARRTFGALAGASAAALPADLAERTMLGDAGANGLGILLGLAAVEAGPVRVRALLVAVVLGLTAASERVSFSAVIDRSPVLAWLDGVGRRA